MSDDLFFQEKKGRKLYFIPVLKKGKRSTGFSLQIFISDHYFSLAIAYRAFHDITYLKLF